MNQKEYVFKCFINIPSKTYNAKLTGANAGL
jgi:hypothetical protein